MLQIATVKFTNFVLLLVAVRMSQLILLQKDNTYTKLFVGGLPYHTTDETLREFFTKFGELDEAVVIIDKTTKKSKGYGFVSAASSHRQLLVLVCKFCRKRFR